MGLKEEVVKIVDNVKDAISEGTHRSAADAEQAKRDVAGDAMTPGENIASMANQAKHTVAAEIDGAKQDIRSNS